MNKVVEIKGLDCPNCARALQNEINKIDGVKNAEIDFLKAKLYFECEDFDYAIKQIVKVAKDVEPDATIVYATKHTDKNKSLWLDILTLTLGVVLGIVSLFVPLSNLAFWIVFVCAVLFWGYKTYIKAVKLLVKGIINTNTL